MEETFVWATQYELLTIKDMATGTNNNGECLLRYYEPSEERLRDQRRNSPVDASKDLLAASNSSDNPEARELKANCKITLAALATLYILYRKIG